MKLNKIMAGSLAGATALFGSISPVMALDISDSKDVTVVYDVAEEDGTATFHLNKSRVELAKDAKILKGDFGYWIKTGAGNYKTSNTDVEAFPTKVTLDKDKVVITASDDETKTIDVNVESMTAADINSVTSVNARKYTHKLNLKETYEKEGIYDASNAENTNKYSGKYNLSTDELDSIHAGSYSGTVKITFEADLPETPAGE